MSRPSEPLERWSTAEPYERFMGRWSRPLAGAAMRWLSPDPGGRWLDVGCGTGSVSEAVLDATDPRSVTGIDQAAAYVDAARRLLADPRATFKVGAADALPAPDATMDHVVSGLVLNFVPDIAAVLAEMRRVLEPGGRVTAWVWDYAQGMQMLRIFWDAVIAEDPASAHLDEGPRFPVCREGGLAECLETSGFVEVRSGDVVISQRFRDFDDYWDPFLGGQGPASAYLLALPAAALERLRARLQAALPVQADGSIHLEARAWIATGTSPG